MKKLLTLAAIISCICNPILAQIDETILPQSSTYSPSLFNKVDEVVLPAFSAEQASLLDFSDAKNGTLPKFSRAIPVNFNLSNTGNWTELPDGGSIWQLRLTSKGAMALVPVFEKLFLPPGATLHVYMPGKEEVIGAFTHANTPDVRGFCTGIIHGESCIIEYYEPAAQRGQGILQLESMGHAYRWVKPLRRTARLGESDTCQVDINCSEGAKWQDQKRAVSCILVVDKNGEGFCSGSLINNVKSDCKPYLLSAQHCSLDAVPADYSKWVFYFNYESATCGDTTAPLSQFINGCTNIADSDDDGGDYGSDFLLLRLSQPVPSSFNAYLAGWDRSANIPDSGVAIHHPQADIKKISTSLSPPAITSWVGLADSTHWDVTWEPTDHGHGVTEEGSSGAALFNQNGHIVGTLTGGDSYCVTPFATDQFGRFYFDWDMNGANDTLQLRPWLDPDNTGTVILPGRNNTCVTGITPVKDSAFEFEVYPNPSTGWVQLKFNDFDNRTIRIFDLFGRKVQEEVHAQKTVSLNLSMLAKGVYILNAESTKGMAVQRIILN